MTSRCITRLLYWRLSSLQSSKRLLSVYGTNFINRQIDRSSILGQVDNRTMKIYTKTGDAGTSALFTGERRPKDDNTFEALGTIDELSCAIGLSLDLMAEVDTIGESGKFKQLPSQLEKIQCDLQDVASHVATVTSDKASDRQLDKVQFRQNAVTELEQWIDGLDADLPPLKNFILPGGGKIASTLHLSRAICRRLERRLVPMVLDEAEPLFDASVYKYVNRLSDYIFMAARFAAQSAGNADRIYRRVSGAQGGPTTTGDNK